MLPDEVRKPAGLFYAFYSDVLKGTLGVSTRITFWMREYGLTADEVKGVLHRMTDPGRCEGVSYAGQLMAALSAEVAAVLDKKREAARRAKQRAYLESMDTYRAPPMRFGRGGDR